MGSILGKKVGMTNIFNRDGAFVPVTVIEAGPCVIVGLKTIDREGYAAMTIAYGEKKKSRVKKPEAGFFKKIGIEAKKTIKEVRLGKNPECKVGDIIAAGIFKVGDFVDITGTTKGKGFQGGMKRWNWAGGGGGHGSMFHRAPGSIGASSYPSRVHKGKTMPGHMGNVRNTVQNLEIVEVDEQNGLLAVRGGVPGPRGSLLFIKHAKKIKPAGSTGAAKQEDAKNSKAKV